MSTSITYAGLPSLQPPDLRGNDPVAGNDDPGATPGPGRKPHVCFVAPTAWPVIAGVRDIPVVGGALIWVPALFCRHGHSTVSGGQTQGLCACESSSVSFGSASRAKGGSSSAGR